MGDAEVVISLVATDWKTNQQISLDKSRSRMNKVAIEQKPNQGHVPVHDSWGLVLDGHECASHSGLG